MENKPLSDKQEAFCRYYVSNGFNGTQAAISAGYAEDSGAVEAVRLLRNAKIADKIAELQKGTVARAKKGADDIYEFASRGAFFDIGEVMEMDDSGAYLKDGKKLSDLPKEIRQLIQTVKSKPTAFGVVNEIVFVDKLRLLEMLARFNGMNNDRIKVEGDLENKSKEELLATLKAERIALGLDE